MKQHQTAYSLAVFLDAAVNWQLQHWCGQQTLFTLVHSAAVSWGCIQQHKLITTLCVQDRRYSKEPTKSNASGLIFSGEKYSSQVINFLEAIRRTLKTCILNDYFENWFAIIIYEIPKVCYFQVRVLVSHRFQASRKLMSKSCILEFMYFFKNYSSSKVGEVKAYTCAWFCSSPRPLELMGIEVNSDKSLEGETCRKKTQPRSSDLNWDS